MDKWINLRNSKFLFGLFVAGYWVACAPRNFSKDPTVDRCQNFAENCAYNPEDRRDHFDYSKTANGGLVDILFVNDNSGSMSFEQDRMAQQFTNFLPRLEQRYIDYRIGVISTDVSTGATQALYPNESQFWTKNNPPRSINGNGALQDGNLISGNGVDFFITSNTPQKEQVFASAIQRVETETCENYLSRQPVTAPTAQGLLDNCPAQDERGIFAANLFFDKNPSSFVRPNAHLAVIFLSDEDERGKSSTTKPLASYDQPRTLLEKINKNYSGKSVSFHSIVVNDANCKAIQDSQMGPDDGIHQYYKNTANQVFGEIGYKYREASQLTNGILGNICASVTDSQNSYGAQLDSISANIIDRITDMTLACARPDDLEVTLNPSSSAITWTVSDKVLHFSKALPPGTQVHLKYSCPAL